MFKVLNAAVLGFAFTRAACHGQGTIQPVTITFDGPPLQPPGTASYIQQYYESGFAFRPLHSFGFGRAGGGIAGQPENGTAFLFATLGDSLVFGHTNNALFSLASVDLAEYSTVVPDPVTVRFVGYRLDGSIVTTEFTTDGIIDGTGPLADFQTFTFDSRFTDLVRVEIPTYGWSLDNLVLVPEPGTTALMVGGGVCFCVTWRRGRQREGSSKSRG